VGAHRRTARASLLRFTRLGVLGWPVAHSLSPTLHNAALESAGLSGWRYQLLPVPPELFAEALRALPGAGFRGANVTIPHKRAALQLATEATARAAAIGAANTLLFSEGAEVQADNTDAPALIDALPFQPAGKTALVLGAGGSARAAVWALGEAGASEVRIWNRTAERAIELCRQLGGSAVSRAEPADIIVNCTPVGLDGSDRSFDQLPLRPEQLAQYKCVVDFVYAAGNTALVRAARQRALPVVDGLDLLVRQGALSFEQFTSLPAPLEVMRRAVRAERAAIVPTR
jgi:shikimate dehydrogenase